MQQFSSNYPLKNRKRSDLGVIDIHIEHSAGVERLDPNRLILLFVTPDGLAKAAALKPVEGAVSDLSGKPAVIYRTDVWELPLTIDEIAALAGAELTPEEFVTLRDRYGIGFETHDDFYDEIDGVALQPKGLRERYLQHIVALDAGLEPTDAAGIYLTPKA